MGKGNFEGEKGRPIVSIARTLCGRLCKNGLNDQDAVCVEDSGGHREPCTRRGPDPHGRE